MKLSWESCFVGCAHARGARGVIGLLLLALGTAALPTTSGAAEHGAAPSRLGTPKGGKELAVEEPAAPEPERVPASTLDALRSPNLNPLHVQPKVEWVKRDYQKEIDAARVLRREREHAAAGKLLLGLLEEKLPLEFRRAVMFELAMVAQDDNQLGRAQQILAQYLQLFPGDPTVPEVLLRQGLIYRQMGANGMAVTKFYAVMNSALGMQMEQFDYYKRLVLQAQTEIADTFYQQGKFPDAIEFYKRILKQNAVELNRPQVHSKFIRCLTALQRHAEAVVECDLFFEQYPQSSEIPELRFVCAESLRQLGRRRDSMLQVLQLLESQKETVRSNPESWVYWQQKAGNQIGNEFYKDGDYLNALEIYNRMVAVNTNAAWQVPVLYQTGLIYERLQQPALALERFEKVIDREKDIAASSDVATLSTVLAMAKWRKQNMGWQNRAEVAIQALKLPPLGPVPPTNGPSKQ
jgi:tetratricopeptide (TPR) repeat protein